ncbi:MAG: class I SAM-dependent methyltransferase [Acidobacteriota bacterium]|nr:class I SAM-dependent methyltransferase [Acidobacteriota bacterium]
MNQVPPTKPQKELAFIQDLLIAPDWGERFAALIDEYVKVPKKGRLLYAGTGTGGHALVLRERAGQKIEFLGVDESDESIEIARAKAVTLGVSAEFRTTKLDQLEMNDNQFDLVVGDLSLVAPERIPGIIAQLVRVAGPGGKVAVVLPTSSSFGEFFSIYWEALYNSEFAGEVDLERLLNGLPTTSELEEIARLKGLVDVATWTKIEAFDFHSGEEFLNTPLISDFLMKGWMASIPENKQKRVTHEIANLINAERHEAEFLLTVKATLLMGHKPK